MDDEEDDHGDDGGDNFPNPAPKTSKKKTKRKSKEGGIHEMNLHNNNNWKAQKNKRDSGKKSKTAMELENTPIWPGLISVNLYGSLN